MNRTLGSRLLALITAYALALNAVLPILAFAATGDDVASAVICRPGGERGASQAPIGPERPHPVCPCVMAGCAGSTLPGRVERPEIAVAWIAVETIPLPHDSARPVSRSSGGWRARGPPAA
jgi:hypothetical protein